MTVFVFRSFELRDENGRLRDEYTIIKDSNRGFVI